MISAGKNLTKFEDTQQLKNLIEESKDAQVIETEESNEEDKRKNVADPHDKSMTTANEHKNKPSKLKLDIVTAVMMLIIMAFGAWLEYFLKETHFEEFNGRYPHDSYEKIKFFHENIDQFHELSDRLDNLTHHTWPKMKDNVKDLSEIIKKLINLKKNL